MATITENIRSGKYDKNLDRIIEACRERKEARIYSLTIGDKVRFPSNTRPEYLAGRTATILEWRRTRILLQLDPGYMGRFRSGKLLVHAVSVSAVEKA